MESAFACLLGIRITQLRTPVGSAAFGCEIKQVPQRPYQIHMTGVVRGIRRSKHQLSVIEVIDPSIAPGEDIERRRLVSLVILALVIVIVCIGCRRQNPHVLPTTFARNVANPLNGRFCHYKKIDALIDVQRCSVQSVQD